MSATVSVAGSDANLVELVRSRLADALVGRAVRAVSGEHSEARPTDTWIILDSSTVAPTTVVRMVDWSLLGTMWAKSQRGDDDLASARISLDGALSSRIDVLRALLDVPVGPAAVEFHASLRVQELPRSVAFYAWLLNGWPREWTHRYATFVRPELALNFVLMVADGHELHHDTLYHLGIAMPDRAAVIDTYHRARRFGARVFKPPRTTWRGTPLHELWLEDPDGTLVEVYARLTAAELAEMPADQEPWLLVADPAG